MWIVLCLETRGEKGQTLNIKRWRISHWWLVACTRDWIQTKMNITKSEKLDLDLNSQKSSESLSTVPNVLCHCQLHIHWLEPHGSNWSVWPIAAVPDNSQSCPILGPFTSSNCNATPMSLRRCSKSLTKWFPSDIAVMSQLLGVTVQHQNNWLDLGMMSQSLGVTVQH